MKKSTTKHWIILGLVLVFVPALLTYFLKLSYGAESLFGAITVAGVIIFLVGLIKAIIGIFRKKDTNPQEPQQ